MARNHQFQIDDKVIVATCVESPRFIWQSPVSDYIGVVGRIDEIIPTYPDDIMAHVTFGKVGFYYPVKSLMLLPRKLIVRSFNSETIHSIVVQHWEVGVPFRED